MAQPTQVREIRVVVDTKGSKDLRDISDALGNVSKNTKKLAGDIGGLKNAFIGYFAALRVVELTRIADSMQQLFDRISVLTGGAGTATAVFEQLNKIANSTKTSIDQLATVFARLQLALKGTGASSRVVLQLTELLQNSFRLSGATTEEATGSTIQLAQSFATGALRGEELRSVLEGNAVIADILREKYGKDLFAKAKAGAITTAEVLKLLFKEQERINSSAAKLGQTFGQTLTVAMNDFKEAVRKANDTLGLSSGFAKGVQFLSERIEIIGAGIAVLALTQIPKLIFAVGALTKAFYLLSLSNPFTALIALDVFLAVTFVRDLDELGTAFKRCGLAILEFFAILKPGEGIFRKILEGNALLIGALDLIGGSAESAAKKLARSIETDELIRYNRELEKARAAYSEESKAKKEREELLARLAGQTVTKEAKLKDILGEVNKAYLAGKITAEQYQTELNKFEVYKLNRQFKEGKIDLEKYNLQLGELTRQGYGQELARNVLAIKDFNNLVRESKIEDLNTKLKAGTINLKEYNAEFIKLSEKLNYSGAFQVGLQNYIDSVGTASTMLADSIKTTFGTLEEEIFQATKNGEFNFARFTQSVLDDLQRIVIRALIVKPIVEGILGYFGGAPTGNSAGQSYANVSATAAHGASFDGGVKKFAAGGVVDSPSLFGFGKGKIGLMGEAGSEAILPLKRGPSGDLGVSSAAAAPVFVNITNNAGADIQQSESSGPNGERVIEVLIQRKVKEGLASGAFDKQLANDFGLKRKGS